MDIITIIGLLAATCTTTSFIPQIVKSVKTKNTKDLSLRMYLILAMGTLLWSIYGILNKSLPIIIANTIALSFSLIILALKFKYK